MKYSNWWNNRKNNFYYKLSKIKKVRSRAWFKLQEIDNKENLFKKNMLVLDLGCSPGSWSQYVSKKIAPNGKIIACDLLFMKYINLVKFIQIDINNPNFIHYIKKIIKNKKFDIIISDICPNITGIKYLDIINYKKLLNIQLYICNCLLKYNGNYITKIFLMDDLIIFKKKLKLYFKFVTLIKSNISLKNSKEIYLIAKNYNL